MKKQTKKKQIVLTDLSQLSVLLDTDKATNSMSYFCPITNNKLIQLAVNRTYYDGYIEYYQEEDNTILYEQDSRRPSIFKITQNTIVRYFVLSDDNWSEYKIVPYGNSLFKIDDFSKAWVDACSLAQVKELERIKQREYWDANPAEDPRIKAKTIALEKVHIMPLAPPTSMLYYIDLNINKL